MILYILKKGTYLQRVEFAVKMVTVKHSIFFFFFFLKCAALIGRSSVRSILLWQFSGGSGRGH